MRFTAIAWCSSQVLNTCPSHPGTEFCTTHAVRVDSGTVVVRTSKWMRMCGMSGDGGGDGDVLVMKNKQRDWDVWVVWDGQWYAVWIVGIGQEDGAVSGNGDGPGECAGKKSGTIRARYADGSMCGPRMVLLPLVAGPLQASSSEAYHSSPTGLLCWSSR